MRVIALSRQSSTSVSSEPGDGHQRSVGLRLVTRDVDIGATWRTPGVAHAPRVQRAPPAQTTPHAPQFAASARVFTHRPLHDVSGGAHVHRPAAQTSVAAHP